MAGLAFVAACSNFLSSNSIAWEVAAHCRMVVDGQEVWNGKCCVEATADPYSMSPSLNAEGWQACLYRKKHPEQANLPTAMQKCFGPWINIYQDSGSSSYSAYWSLENACHCGPNVSAKRNGNIYQGDNFIFEWR